MKKNLLLIALLLPLCLISCSPGNNAGTAVERVENYLKEIESVGFSGSVLVEYQGKKVIYSGYGFRDQEKKLKNTPSTVFDIASITKQFTAAAILKLEMDGKLTVNDSVSMYFTSVPDDKSGITIHDLLRHQSGLQSNVGGDFDLVTKDDFIELVFSSRLRFEAGTSFGYSNIGYSLLALIVEKVSGLSYEDYLYENLWKPSGMQSTGYSRPSFDPDEVAVVYYQDDRIWGKPNEKEWGEVAPYLHLAGNGGILSTTEDLYKWHQALLGDEILSESARQKLYHPEIREDESPEGIYAYGWDVSTTPRGTRLAWHNGTNGFLYADFHRFIDEGIAIIMLSNKSHPNFDILNREIIRIIFDPDYTPITPHPDNEANREFTDRILVILSEDGSEKALKEYQTRDEGINLLDFRMRNAGFRYLFNLNEPEIALAVFQFNAGIFPDSAPALRGLAEAYMETGQHEMAVEYFKRSLAIDPDSPFAKEMVAQLEMRRNRNN